MDADKKRLWVSGQFIEVTDEVYDAYMKGDRKMRYFESNLKTERLKAAPPFRLGKPGLFMYYDVLAIQPVSSSPISLLLRVAAKIIREMSKSIFNSFSVQLSSRLRNSSKVPLFSSCPP